MIGIKHLRWLLLAGLLLVGGTMVFYLVTNRLGHDVDIGGIQVMGTDADLQINRMHVVHNANGTKEWEMWADRAKVYRDQDVTKLENLRLRLYPRGGEPADVSAERGVMENKSRNMSIEGNVLIRSADGMTLRTESLEFNPKEKRVDSDAHVTVEGKTFRLTGVGLHGNTQLGRYVLKKQVTALIYDTDLRARQGTITRPGSKREAAETQTRN